MITRALRRAMKHEEGQALVLACLMCLILALAVMTTVNFGHTVGERVRLQNTADASAYSMAAMEARAFNFYAFANRTQVSHYVSAMIWMSIDSFVYFTEAFITDVYGMLSTIVQPNFAKLLGKLPGVGAIVTAVQGAVDLVGQAAKLAQGAIKDSDIDRKVGKELVPEHVDFNMALAGMSQAVIASVLFHVNSTNAAVMAGGTIALNDPNLGGNLHSQEAVNVINGCMLDRAHWADANGTADDFTQKPTEALDPALYKEVDKVARAKRSMGMISNASRFACDEDGAGKCPDAFVTQRDRGTFLPMVNGFGLVARIPGLKNMVNAKLGQAGMLSYNLAKGGILNGAVMSYPKAGTCQYLKDTEAKQNELRDQGAFANQPMGVLGQGDNLGADDVYDLRIGNPRVGLHNPLACDPNDDWRKCWGEPRECGGNDAIDGSGNCSKVDPNYMMKTSVWALNGKDRVKKGGVHWRLDRRAGDAPQMSSAPKLKVQLEGMASYPVCITHGCMCSGAPAYPLVYKWVGYVQPMTAANGDGNHTWPGLAPFPHFEPGQYAEACAHDPSTASSDNPAPREMDFNQPSSFTVLNKTATQLRNPLADPTGASRNDPAMLNNTGKVTFNFSQGQTLDFNDERVEFLNKPGLNVMSRGLTYYHRPGDWAETPNFFNPYWRPRLASVWQGRTQLPLVETYVNTLPDTFKNMPQKILTH